VLLQGKNDQEKLARVFDDAGDFNGDGYADVVVGSENAFGGKGEVVVVFGSQTLESPAGGWTTDSIVAAGRAVRFIGETAGDHAGTNVAGLGNIDGDKRTVRLQNGTVVRYNLDDLLVAAPDAAGGKGKVYLIYGNSQLSGDIQLSKVGTVSVPGAVFTGRVGDSGGVPGDHLGGGEKTVPNTDPSNNSTIVRSRGVAKLGDFDGDGKLDFAISAILANPDGKRNAGEVYILYGRGD
jgi:hypothetical protein